jgi:3-mercaptopyruvate sulfurtransferase SseA
VVSDSTPFHAEFVGASHIKSMTEVLEHSQQQNADLIDARSAPRFNGTMHTFEISSLFFFSFFHIISSLKD